MTGQPTDSRAERTGFDPPAEGVQIIPLGGVGEFGANATLIRSARTTVLIDFGLMFPPDHSLPGVDFYINDPEGLLRDFPELSAVFLTHAHEDHIGGLGFLLGLRDLELYTLPYTARILRAAARGLLDGAQLHEVALNQSVDHGDLSFEFIGVTHSIAQACALLVRTPEGAILHSGDFKVDPLPGDGHPFQSDRLRQLGDEGLDLLLMDSTNANKPGFCPGESEIMPALEALIRDARGRVFLTTFSSHMPRIRRLAQIAKRQGRRVVLLGRSFQKHHLAALETGYMEHDPQLFISVEKAEELPDNRLLYVLTGSQGEPRSALKRVSSESLSGVSIRAGDRVIFSSKVIPGHERRVALLVGNLESRGVEVFTSRTRHIHTSGHAFREDLAYLLALTRPTHVAPIHGEFHQLSKHRQWLDAIVNDSQKVWPIMDGDVLTLSNGSLEHEPRGQSHMLPIDGNQNLPLTRTILKDRKDMMYSGLVLISIRVGSSPPNECEVALHGLVEAREGALAEAIGEALRPLEIGEEMEAEKRTKLLSKICKKVIKSFFSGRPLMKIVLNGKIVK